MMTSPQHASPARVAIVAAAGIVLSQGCSSTDRRAALEADSTFTYDSAGITIVENPGYAKLGDADAGNSGERTWTRDLTIGVASGNLRYQFLAIRSAIRLRDGRIAISDAVSGAIRYYDSSGMYLRASGREGSEPGEFTAPPSLFRFRGDSILAQDGARDRVLSIFDETGRFVRTFHLPQPPPADNALRGRSYVLKGVFDDGSLLVLDAERPSFPASDGQLREFSGRALRVDHEGRMLADFGEFVYERSAGAALPGMTFIVRTAPFPQGLFAAAGTLFVHADASRLEYRVYSQDGPLLRIVRLSTHPALPLTRERWAAMDRIDLQVHGDDDPSWQAIEDAKRMLPLPDSLSPLAHILMDNAGTVTAGVYTDYLDAAPRTRWLTFDALGRIMPPPYVEMDRVTHATDTHRVTISRDAQGVERIQIWSKGGRKEG